MPGVHAFVLDAFDFAEEVADGAVLELDLAAELVARRAAVLRGMGTGGRCGIAEQPVEADAGAPYQAAEAVF